ncbi:hypothetical protein EON82_25280, partial [bacterium]
GADTLNGGDGADVIHGGDADLPFFGEVPFIERLSESSSGQQAAGTSVDPYLSPDGETVLFWSTADNIAGSVATYGLFMRDLDTGQVTRVPINVTSNVAISFSPDGSMIAYRAPGDGGSSIAYVLNLNTNTTTAVSVNDAGAPANVLTAPVFSADGQSILAVTEQLSPGWEDGSVFLVEWSLSGGAPTHVGLDVSPLLTNGAKVAADFSADRAQVVLRYVSSGYGYSDLYDTQTGQSTAVLQSHYNDRMFATFSADNSTIAFAAGEGGVRLYDVASGTERVLLDGVEDRFIQSAQFALGGTALIVSARYDIDAGHDDYSINKILLVDIESGAITELAVGQDPVVSADGGQIVFQSYERLTPDDTSSWSDIFLMTLPGVIADSDTLNGGAGADI